MRTLPPTLRVAGLRDLWEKCDLPQRKAASTEWTTHLPRTPPEKSTLNIPLSKLPHTPNVICYTVLEKEEGMDSKWFLEILFSF